MPQDGGEQLRLDACGEQNDMRAGVSGSAGVPER
jgi:hypothetical protein